MLSYVFVNQRLFVGLKKGFNLQDETCWMRVRFRKRDHNIQPTLIIYLLKHLVLLYKAVMEE